jgi:hypothetical protein
VGDVNIPVSEEKAKGAEIPDVLSGIDLSSNNSKQINIKFGEAKVATVIVFLSIKCPCSASHQSALKEMAENYKERGIRFVGIHSNADESFELSATYFKEASLGFPVIQDENAKYADRFRAFKTPHVFVLSPKKEVLFKGGVDNSKVVSKATQHYLKDTLSTILNGKKPEKVDVRVVGCEIKRP